MISVPPALEERLSEDRKLHAAVSGSLADFSPWLENSGLPLFPNYTDHGPRHVEGVLRTVEWLVSDTAWDELSAADSAAIVLSVLLHDVGMSLSEDGFLSLIAGAFEAADARTDRQSARTWPQLWDEFFYAALRWDDRQLKRVFGDQAGGDAVVDRIPDDPQTWTLGHRLLAGEFVRNYHPRLAYEVALKGVPGPDNNNRLRLSAHLEPDLAELIGIVARSHGTSLRENYAPLEELGAIRDYRGLHAVYDMILLRIADFLQVEATRAPKEVLSVKRFRNATSRREWMVHHAVKHIHRQHDDPEAITVLAQPATVSSFLGLSEWASSLQRELDASWASLGEIYGRYFPLTKLGIVVRRVKTNLHEGSTDDRRWPFVPRRIRFDVARPELLQLMIRPLYGDRPEIGIRELLQNAVDAVRERKELTRDFSEPPRLRQQAADVVIEIETPKESQPGWIHVSDKGIGMTAEVVTDYFLNAGASYRASGEWKQRFERPGTAGLRRGSVVLRTGRFGVGALAAFLLGDHITVETRHVEAEVGLRFAPTLDDEAIELMWDDTLLAGTRISIPITEATWRKIREGRRGWFEGTRPRLNWYCWAEPSVLVVIDGYVRQQDWTIPQGEGNGSRGWIQLADAPGFGPVYWSNTGGPHLSVNGIVVQIEGVSEESNLVVTDTHKVRVPALDVSDPDGFFPLVLQRDRMSAQIPFRKQLLRSIVADCAEHFREEASPLTVAERTDLTYIAIDNTDWNLRLEPWFVVEDGITLLTDRALRALDVRHLNLVPSTRWRGGVTERVEAPWQHLKPGEGAVAFTLQSGRTHLVEDLRRSLAPERLQRRLPKWIQRIVGRRLTAPWGLGEVLKSQSVPRYIRDLNHERIGSWIVLRTGDCMPSSLQPTNMGVAEIDAWYPWFVEWDLDPAESDPTSEDDAVDELEEAWLECVGGWKLQLS